MEVTSDNLGDLFKEIVYKYEIRHLIAKKSTSLIIEFSNIMR